MLQTVSVVIPAWNEQAAIGNCLTSLCEQDYGGRVEVIVVDNASTDQTAATARAHGATVVHEPTRGVCHARQRGTLAATGAIVVSTDADTTFDPGWISRIVAAMTSDDAVVASCGPCRFVEAPGWARFYTGALFGLTGWIYRHTGRVAYASATNIAFRRDAWTGYDLRLTQGGDELGLLRSLRPIGRIHFDATRVTLTSARRLHRGLLYNVFVTCLFFYFGAYVVNRIARRSVIGGAPTFRDDHPVRRRSRRVLAAAALVLLATAVTWRLVPGDVI